MKMKRKLLTCVLCIVLVFAMTAPTFATGVESTVTFQEVQELTSRLEEADGHIPNDFTQEDMDKFLKNAEPELVAEVMKKISENAKPLPIDIIDGQSITAPEGPRKYIEYDPETKEETIHYLDEVSSNSEVQQLAARLEKADGHIPDDFTREDMEKFLAEADKEQISEAMKKICENAKAVPIETVDADKQSGKVPDVPRSYIEFDSETGEETVHYFDEVSTVKEMTESEEIYPADEATITPRAYPNFWSEIYPQNFADTRSTCKVIIKTNGYGDFEGSGYLVSDDTMLTSSQCFYSSKFGGRCDYLVVIPSYSGSYLNGYYGTTTSGSVKLGNYRSTGYPGDDWAIVKLNNHFSMGSMEIVSYGSNKQKNMWIRVQGYPELYPDTQSVNWDMYLTTGECTNDYSDYYKTGSAKIYQGMNGGPVLTKTDDNRYFAVGIISSTQDSSGNFSYVAFDTNLYNLINSYI